jgi:hypothetical protein
MPREMAGLLQALGTTALSGISPFSAISPIGAYTTRIVDRVTLSEGIQQGRFRRYANPELGFERAYQEAWTGSSSSEPGPEGTFVAYGADRLVRTFGGPSRQRIDVVV